MSPLRKLKALCRIASNVDFGASGGCAGVGPFKLKKDYFLEAAAKVHDRDYDFVRWKDGTYEIDKKLLMLGLDAAETQNEVDEVIMAFSLARTYSRIRQGLSFVGIKW